MLTDLVPGSRRALARHILLALVCALAPVRPLTAFDAQKDAAKQLMDEAGVPTTPGYLGANQDPAHLQKEADAIGYPALIKAVAGGGGKGMRRVNAADEFADRRDHGFVVLWHCGAGGDVDDGRPAAGVG